MRLSIVFPALSAREAGVADHASSRLARWLVRLVVSGLCIARVMGQEAPSSRAKDEFSSLVKLAPVVVNGKSLAISIYARTRSDRHYGEDFSERVVKVVYEAVTESTGKGLVIIGAKGEPHPIFVFRKFLALAKDGKLNPALAARGPELSTMLDRWQDTSHTSNSGKSKGGESEPPDMEFEKILPALPLPLTGVGAKLYQLAWEEKFDDAKVEARLRALSPDDLECRDLFKSFDWVFYLPPKGAFDRAFDEVIAAALKEEKMGFFARTAVKGALLVLKPKLRRAIEAMRQGMMFMTVVQAQTHWNEKEVSALTGSYIDVFMPFESKGENPLGSTDHERAVNAVREQLRKNADKSKQKQSSEPVTTEGAKPAAAELE